MSRASILALAMLLAAQADDDGHVPAARVEVPRVATDPSVKLDYDIVYVRAPRHGDDVGTNWAEISSPLFMDPGADLMLLHPDGEEEVLVAGGKGAVADPMVSFDGEWVYYTLFHDLDGATTTEGAPAGADIYRIHTRTHQIVRLTHQQFTPNTGAGDWSSDFRTPEPGKNSIGYGVFNTGPCPLPGGKVVFTSNRNAFKPPKRLPHTLQLFVMDDDGRNVECIGHLNLGMALHPTVLKDGRIIFSSLESQGLRTSTLWGLWSIHPDGTNWGPILSAFLPGESPSAYHFQTQLSDGSIVAEEYYNQTSSGFGGFVKLPPPGPSAGVPFGPGYRDDPRNPPLAGGFREDGRARTRRLPFSADRHRVAHAVRPHRRRPRRLRRAGPEPRASRRQGDASLRRAGQPSPGRLVARAGQRRLHRSCPGRRRRPLPHQGRQADRRARPDAVDQERPAVQRAVAPRPGPLRRIYGIDEPKSLPPLANDGKRSPQLPEGTPFGLVGTSSLYKRESYPNGVVPPGRVTATVPAGPDRTGGFGELDPFNTSLGGVSSTGPTRVPTRGDTPTTTSTPSASS